MFEQWRPVPGYEGIYSVSNLGRVRRDAPGSTSTWPGRILKLIITFRGYHQVSLSLNGHVKIYETHRLVGISFLGEPPRGAEINHKNGIKTDNRVENLEWVTPKENIQHAYRTGRLPQAPTFSGEKHPRAKFTLAQAEQIRNRYRAGGITHRELAKEYRVGKTTMSELIEQITYTK